MPVGVSVPLDNMHRALRTWLRPPCDEALVDLIFPKHDARPSSIPTTILDVGTCATSNF